MRFCIAVLCALESASSIFAAIHTYNWDITWVLANPDGRKLRPVIGINNKWPPPLINVTMGDSLEVVVNNKLGNETTGIHWHGILQTGSTAMDGPRGVTQCPIPPGSSFTYSFTVNQPGEYWYHSHDIGQFPDGLRGPIIVQDPSSPYAGKYDAELVLTVSDWYHDQMPYLMPYYLSVKTNPDGGEPEPYSALFNDNQNIKYSIEPNLTYLIRIINIGTFAQFYVQFSEHKLTIIEMDGVYINPFETDQIYVTVAQRYEALMKSKSDSSTNYAIAGLMDVNDFDADPSYVDLSVAGYLIYSRSAPLPPPLNISNPKQINDLALVPLDGQKALGQPTETIVLNISFWSEYNQNRAGFNNITYLEQKVPTLYTAFSAGNESVFPEIYGVNSNTYVLPYGAIVELIVNNYDSGPHPVHIHGHAPQHLIRNSASYYTPGQPLHYAPVPMRRDTWLVPPGGYVLSRFVANNPGVWFFHCHMDWHLLGGLAATFVEAPLSLQATQTIPAAAKSLCVAQGTPTAGNAAGNTKNYFDLRGAVTTPNPSPSGALVGRH